MLRSERNAEEPMAISGRAVIARNIGAPVRVEEIRIDPPGPGEVLVRVLASGVCHTDLHARNGKAGPLPILLGHEGAGIVEQVGEGVTTPRVGDKVILAWRAPCGECRFCRQGLLYLCSNSHKAVPRMHTTDGLTPTPALDLGTMCTHTVVHSGRTVVVPSDTP